MKKLIFPALIIIGVLSLRAQTDKAVILQNLEANQSQQQKNTSTATIKTSTRLFRLKDDLTSVILIVPSGSVVSVLDSDSTYYHVTYDDNEGYIFRKHASLIKFPKPLKKCSHNLCNSRSSRPSHRMTAGMTSLSANTDQPWLQGCMPGRSGRE